MGDCEGSELACWPATGLAACCCIPSLGLAEPLGVWAVEEVRPMPDWLRWGGGGGLLRGEALPLLMSA